MAEHVYSDGTTSLSLGLGQDGEHYQCTEPSECDCDCECCEEAKYKAEGEQIEKDRIAENKWLFRFER